MITNSQRIRRRRLDLAGRTVAITGACGGLGSALASSLLAVGANVALLDLDGDAAASQATELGATSRVRGWPVDVRDSDSLDGAMQAIAAHFGGIDVVVAAAGVLPPVATMTASRQSDWDRAIDINLSGVWRTFRSAAPYVTARQGHLLALSSMVGFVHPPMLGAYAASKAGVWAMCDSLRLELRPLGVTVGSVHPMIFRTPMIGDALGTPAAAALVNGFTGPFETVALDTVVADILRGVQRRAAHVVSPRRMTVASLAPGLLQRLLEGVAFRESQLDAALKLGAVPAPAPDSHPSMAMSTASQRPAHARPLR